MPEHAKGQLERKSSRRKRWLVAGVALISLTGAAIYLFEWNWFRPLIERQVGNATGRRFQMRGDLDVRLSRTPQIIAHDLVLANAGWSEHPEMATVKRLQVSVDLSSLWQGRVRLAHIEADEPVLLLERNRSGQGNWLFDAAKDDGDNLGIGRLVVRQGRLRWLDPATKTDLLAELDTSLQANAPMPVSADIGGRYQGLPTRVQLSGGALLSLRDRKQPYPLRGSGQIGATRFSADGTVTDPLLLSGLAVNFSLAGRSLAELFPILHLPLPATPDYQLKGRLEHAEQYWNLLDFQGKVGASDLGGDFKVNRAYRPQFILADLRSRHLDLRDLSGFIGARTEQGEKALPAGDKVLPQTPFNLDKLRAANVDLRFHGQRIVTEKWPFDDLQAHMLVRDSRIDFKPLVLGIAGGKLNTILHMDARQTPIVSHAQIRVQKLELKRLFPQLAMQKASFGVIGGRAKLSGKGNSIAAMLGSANGDMVLAMNGGAISKLLLRLANLDLANTLAVLLTGDKPVPINCMVADMAAKEGELTVRTMLLDTSKQLIVGHGNINMRTEQFDLKLVADQKDMSLAALRGPILITGPFKRPQIRPSLKQATGRAALAAVLGSVAGPLGLLPLLELGDAKNGNCAEVLRRAGK
ncbi:AsmA family protein [Chitinimonas arctica]|uniref:AsmA family protein n=1 Tax=Chitinimonas arctica TaxID=2594795 RepID=A0A516SHB9_9NEIS|nr:AsmA family protein [Chitinimonas arctica]QDQ27547.1 AsmA family protein [Chitinimonas arctica]